MPQKLVSQMSCYSQPLKSEPVSELQNSSVLPLRKNASETKSLHAFIIKTGYGAL